VIKLPKKRKKLPLTRAVNILLEKGVNFDGHFYNYRKDSVTANAAKDVGVDEYQVIKTLVMETEKGEPLIVLMHGNRQVSTKDLARTIGVKTIIPTNQKNAERLTGYQVGGISPFGTRKKLPVFVEKTIFDLTRLFINGGRRGLLLEMSPQVLDEILDPIPVNVAR
jgi:Cys-tRNA(Pro) deacylase